MTLAAVKRFSVAEYHQLTALEFFKEDDRVELIDGQIVEMAAKGAAHEVCITRLVRELPKLLGDRATVRVQSPIVISNHSEPEPDIAIVQNRADDYLAGHPSADDVIWVIEVADSSLRYDQSVKLPLYAQAKIADYWIFNLGDDRLETYSEPYQTAEGKFGYRVTRIVLPNEAIALPGFADRSLDLVKVFPPQAR